MDEVKTAIKLLFTPAVYDCLRSFNKNSLDVCVIIAGGDAINYYVEDSGILTKDFDLKFCIKSLMDWQEYYKPTPNVLNIIKSYEFLSTTVEQFCNQLVNFINTNNLLTQVQARIEDILNAKYGAGFGVKLILKPNFDKASLFGELVNSYSGPHTQAFNYLQTLAILRGHSSRITIVYNIDITKSGTNVASFEEGLVDGVTWSPISYGYTELYKVLKQKYIVDSTSPLSSTFDFSVNEITGYQFGLINRNFSFVQTSDNLFVVSIAFLIWDTIRLINDAQHFLLEQKKSQWSNQRNTGFTQAAYEKYVKKYFAMTEALFAKLRCVEPFQQAAVQCATNATGNNEANLNNTLLIQLRNNFLPSVDFPTFTKNP